MFLPQRSWSASLLVALVAFACAAVIFAQPADADPKYPDDVHFDFRGKPLPPELTLTPEGSLRFVQSEPEGLRITLPKDRADLAPVVVGTRFGIKGDFEITATVEILHAEQPRDGFGVGASLFINKVDPAVEGATLGRLLRAGGKDVVFWDQGFGKTKEQLQFEVDFRPCADALVRLRLKRMGDQLSYQLGKGLGGDNYEELQQKNFGRNDIQQVLVRATTGKQPVAVDMRLIDLRIRSGAVAASAPAAARKGVWLLATLLLALAVGAALGVAHFVRKRHAADHARAFACPGCGTRLTTGTDIAGKAVQCGQCGTAVHFPATFEAPRHA
jgi:hypothetical protein